MIEKADIEALIEKHRPRTLKTPDEVTTLGTGKNAKDRVKRALTKEKSHIKRQQKVLKLKKSCKKGTEAENAKKGKPDALLGNPVVSITTGTEKIKRKGQKDKLI